MAIKRDQLAVQLRPISGLVPYARNARTHSDAQVAQIAASIKEFGFTNPVLVDASGGIIAGHGRVLAARQLSMEKVPTIELGYLSETQKRAYILADNKLALNAGWDQEMLALELGELDDGGFALDVIGFTESEIADIIGERLDEENGDEQDDADDVPEAPAIPVSRTGDIWEIGKHRLVCGDATDKRVVEALMQTDDASLCFTSPPYGNQRNYKSGGGSDWDKLMRGVFGSLPMASGGQVLVNLGLIHRDNEVLSYWDGWLEWMQQTGWRRFGWYVWDQGPGMPGDWAGRLAPSFEFIFHLNSESRKPNKIVPCALAGEQTHSGPGASGMRAKGGDISQWTHAGAPVQEFKIPDSIIRLMRHKGAIGDGIDHPAVFPVALPKFIIEAYSNAGEIVFEPFNGSGTTMIAAQRTGRICRSIEIAPAYVDVAIERFIQHHSDVQVVLVATGQTFEDVASERIAARNAYGST